MASNDEGLTTTYNRFHNPDEHDAGILRLRALHDATDSAVLEAYGWSDLRPTCDFFLDYEEEDTQDDEGKPNKKKRPWRLRWPDESRDEVLARLLALNRESVSQGPASPKAGSPHADPVRKDASP
jgi:hypothetical protein